MCPNHFRSGCKRHGTRGGAYLHGWTGDGALDVDDVLGICFGDASGHGTREARTYTWKCTEPAQIVH